MRDDADMNLTPESDNEQSNISEPLETNNAAPEKPNPKNIASNEVIENSVNNKTTITADNDIAIAEPTPTQPVYGLSALEYQRALEKLRDRKKLARAFIPAILFFVVSIVVSVLVVLMSPFDVDTPLGLSMTTLITTGLMYLLTLIIAKPIYEIDLFSPFTAIPKKPKMAFVTVLFALGIGYLVQIIISPVSTFLPTIEFDYSIFSNPSAFILIFISTAILPALFEEWIYRGFLLKYLLPFGKWPAIVISGVIFGLSHSSPDQAIFAIVFGIMLGIIFVNSGGSIWLTFIIHFLNNAYAVIQMYFSNRYGDASNKMLLVTVPIYIFMGVTLVVLVVTALKGKKAFFLPTPDETKPPYKGKEIAKFVFTSASTYIFLVLSLFFMASTIVTYSAIQ